MKLIKPSYEILTPINGKEILKTLEQIGRICYKSEDRITEDSNQRFCKNILNNQHLSVIEHISISVKFIICTGVSHELVRHRLCSFSQESSRYCNYKGGVAFIIPSWVDIQEGEYNSTDIIDQKLSLHEDINVKAWLEAMAWAEQHYLFLIQNKWSPQQSRAVLPKSLKTEIIVTTNLREWQHILKLRTSSKAHPDMQNIMKPLLKDLQQQAPIIFDDIL